MPKIAHAANVLSRPLVFADRCGPLMCEEAAPDVLGCGSETRYLRQGILLTFVGVFAKFKLCV